MKNVSIINFRNKFSRVHLKKQILSQVKLMLYGVVMMPLGSAFKLYMKAFKLSTIQYNSKMVMMLCDSLDVGLMMFELLLACIAVLILLKIYEYERK